MHKPAFVDVWTATDEGITEDRLRALLSEEERARAGEHLHARDARLFMVAHACLRQVLSHYAAVPPEAWIFQTRGLGRPELAAEFLGTELCFSLSHTADQVAVAVSNLQHVGVDVEDVAAPLDLRELMQEVMSPAEQRFLVRASEEEFRWRFLRFGP